jgi:hypothetical protein
MGHILVSLWWLDPNTFPHVLIFYFFFVLFYCCCFLLIFETGLTPWLKAWSGHHFDGLELKNKPGLNGRNRYVMVDIKVIFSSDFSPAFWPIVGMWTRLTHRLPPPQSCAIPSPTTVDYTLTFRAKIKLSSLKMFLSGFLVRDANITLINNL